MIEVESTKEESTGLGVRQLEMRVADGPSCQSDMIGSEGGPSSSCLPSHLTLGPVVDLQRKSPTNFVRNMDRHIKPAM